MSAKKQQKKVLGRGLSALLGDAATVGRSSDTGFIQPIDIDKIQINPLQPRKDFDEVSLKELAKSWAVGEGLKHSGVADNAEIEFAGHKGIVKHGLNYMQLKESTGMKLIPYSKISNEIIDVKKAGSEHKDDNKKD